VEIGADAARGFPVEAAMRPKATPSIAISIRIPLDIEERRRRLMEQLDCSTPQLFARAILALEAQAALEIAEPTAA
jgi:hypothetical protein